MAKGKTIMLQGTSSGVGKSLLCTALCRIFREEGYRVAPFKAQNMSSHVYITKEGGLIGAAQGFQAEAAGIAATVEMNPILLQPQTDTGARVIVLGRDWGEMSGWDYRREFLPRAKEIVRQCLDRLREEYELLVIEGAGSPAEINLREGDIVNMATAEMAESPVLLVADIHRGGAFASLIGTLELLTGEERKRVKGFFINKFRGDVRLLKPGLDFLVERTGRGVLGVIPYLKDHGIEEEDALERPDENRLCRITGCAEKDLAVREELYRSLASRVRAHLDLAGIYECMGLAGGRSLE
jgi:adenosylcobyric acid synthase